MIEYMVTYRLTQYNKDNSSEEVEQNLRNMLVCAINMPEAMEHVKSIAPICNMASFSIQPSTITPCESA